MALLLGQVLDAAFERIPNAVCAIEDGTSISFSEAREALHGHQQWLQQNVVAAATSSSTATLAYLSHNSVDMLLSVLASCSSLNHSDILVLNTRWTADEIVSVLRPATIRKSHIVLLYGSDSSNSRLQQKAQMVQSALPNVCCHSLPRLTKRVVRSNGAARLHASCTHTPLWTKQSMQQRQDQLCHCSESSKTALILFTSGTTSIIPKGVCLSHRAILWQALAKLLVLEYNHTTRLLLSLPLYHVGGLSSALAVWLAGGCLLVNEWKQFPYLGPDGTPNTLVVVPAMLHNLLQDPSTIKMNPCGYFPDVKFVLIGGQSASPGLLQQCSKLFPNSKWVQTYACTEAASSLTFSEATIDTKDEDCVGSPPSGIDLAIVTEDGHFQNAPRRVGRIATRGPHVMNGYWQQPEHCYEMNDWFVTNDLGYLDEMGRLYFSGRITDSIRTGGETVMALHVERVLAQHPDIQECAVFGLKDDRFGEIVSCALVCCPGKCLSLLDVRKWCQQNGLADYKQPRRVFRVTNLPRNSSGKVLKYKLVEQLGSKPRSKL